MIPREQHVATLLERLRTLPVVVIAGARQIAKTTLARQVGRAYGSSAHRLDLERPANL